MLSCRQQSVANGPLAILLVSHWLSVACCKSLCEKRQMIVSYAMLSRFFQPMPLRLQPQFSAVCLHPKKFTVTWTFSLSKESFYKDQSLKVHLKTSNWNPLMSLKTTKCCLDNRRISIDKMISVNRLNASPFTQSKKWSTECKSQSELQILRVFEIIEKGFQRERQVRTAAGWKVGRIRLAKSLKPYN